jgi:hypothetical protein
MGEMRNTYKLLVRKPEGKRPPGRLKHRWKNTTKFNLREIGWDVFDWVHVAESSDHWQPLVNTITNFWVP